MSILAAEKHQATDSTVCDWHEGEDGNWGTACGQCLSFDHAPPSQQGCRFCLGCGKPVAFTEFHPVLTTKP